LGADLITISSHKIMGPKGVGALYVSDAVVKNRGLAPMLVGGGQEDGLRSGTENLPGACAFGEAARVYRAAIGERTAHMRELGDYLLSRLATDASLSGVTANLPMGERAPHILSLTVGGMKSETVLNDLSGKGIYVSAGSACSSHDAHLSEALLAFGKSPDEADSTVRVSFSHLNTKDEVDALLDALAETVATRAKKRG
ncbi:MAG: aminotransferase class V-fold PLP-dependent enzyme, partial [Clostridia bacterium]|nr:aminotransferase class V-fold PLP-dependent enzyme [Clostridia bacterium]